MLYGGLLGKRLGFGCCFRFLGYRYFFLWVSFLVFVGIFRVFFSVVSRFGRFFSEGWF